MARIDTAASSRAGAVAKQAEAEVHKSGLYWHNYLNTKYHFASVSYKTSGAMRPDILFVFLKEISETSTA